MWLIRGCPGPFGFRGFGTLLGPEETPVWCVLWAAPGLDHLTRPGRSLVGVGVVVVGSGRGVVVC
jgi:hypothetical protein